MLIKTFFANCQFSQLRDLCPLGMSMGGDGVRRASLERRASLLKSMEPTITIGFAEVAWGKKENYQSSFSEDLIMGEEDSWTCPVPRSSIVWLGGWVG